MVHDTRSARIIKLAIRWFEVWSRLDQLFPHLTHDSSCVLHDLACSLRPAPFRCCRKAHSSTKLLKFIQVGFSNGTSEKNDRQIRRHITQSNVLLASSSSLVPWEPCTCYVVLPKFLDKYCLESVLPCFKFLERQLLLHGIFQQAVWKAARYAWWNGEKSEKWLMNSFEMSARLIMYKLD